MSTNTNTNTNTNVSYKSSMAQDKSELKVCKIVSSTSIQNHITFEIHNYENKT